jgi:hypothetical protein
MKVSIALAVSGVVVGSTGVALVAGPGVALICVGVALVVSGLFRETGSKG